MKSLITLLLSIFSWYAFANTNITNDVTLRKISEQELSTQKKITLDSGWSFYWNELISPGEFEGKTPLGTVKTNSWTKFLDSSQSALPSLGFATYRLKIALPKDRKNLSLYIPRIIGSYKIWVNGVFIQEIGHVGTTKETTQHRKFTDVIDLESQENTFDIVIQVANFYHRNGGITSPLILGPTETLSYNKSIEVMIDMFNIGSFSFIGFLFLIFYVLYWNKDKAILYFAVLCIAISYRTFIYSYVPLFNALENINGILLIKTEYIATYIAVLFAFLYFALILKDFIYKWYNKVIISATVVLLLLVILLPSPHFTKLTSPFLVYVLLNIIYLLFATMKSVFAKSSITKLLLVSLIFGMITLATHVLFFITENDMGLIYVKTGYLVVFLLISLILLQRFSSSFQKLEFAKKIALKQKKEISQKSREISKVNSKLQENLKLLKEHITELDDFNHIVSHDLKSPLVSVYTLVSFIEEDLKGNIDANVKGHVNMLKDVVSKMEASINGLLAYAKVAKTAKKKEVFYINDLLLKVLDFVDQQKTSTHILPGNNIEVFASKIELEHVFQNLISNAIKYNNKEKAIVEITVTETPKNYVFSVSDNGPGIPEQYHDKIFKIFSQLETNQNDVGSTGVGLAIVKKIVSKNNGEITVTSDENKGLTIEFTWAINNGN